MQNLVVPVTARNIGKQKIMKREIFITRNVKADLFIIP